MIKDDGTVIHFNNPKVSTLSFNNYYTYICNWTSKLNVAFSSRKIEMLLFQVQASLAANTFAVTGHAENKRKHFSIFIHTTRTHITPTRLQLAKFSNIFPFRDHRNAAGHFEPAWRRVADPP